MVSSIRLSSLMSCPPTLPSLARCLSTEAARSITVCLRLSTSRRSASTSFILAASALNTSSQRLIGTSTCDSMAADAVWESLPNSSLWNPDPPMVLTGLEPPPATACSV